jgi:hypothetical protein
MNSCNNPHNRIEGKIETLNKCHGSKPLERQRRPLTLRTKGNNPEHESTAAGTHDNPEIMSRQPKWINNLLEHHWSEQIIAEGTECAQQANKKQQSNTSVGWRRKPTTRREPTTTETRWKI